MDKYAVAVCNVYNSTNTIEIVEAEDEIKAIILAVEEEMIDLNIDNVGELLQYYNGRRKAHSFRCGMDSQYII